MKLQLITETRNLRPREVILFFRLALKLVFSTERNIGIVQSFVDLKNSTFISPVRVDDSQREEYEQGSCWVSRSLLLNA